MICLGIALLLAHYGVSIPISTADFTIGGGTILYIACAVIKFYLERHQRNIEYIFSKIMIGALKEYLGKQTDLINSIKKMIILKEYQKKLLIPFETICQIGTKQDFSVDPFDRIVLFYNAFNEIVESREFETLKIDDPLVTFLQNLSVKISELTLSPAIFLEYNSTKTDLMKVAKFLPGSIGFLSEDKAGLLEHWDNKIIKTGQSIFNKESTNVVHTFVVLSVDTEAETITVAEACQGTNKLQKRTFKLSEYLNKQRHLTFYYDQSVKDQLIKTMKLATTDGDGLYSLVECLKDFIQSDSFESHAKSVAAATTTDILLNEPFLKHNLSRKAFNCSGLSATGYQASKFLQFLKESSELSKINDRLDAQPKARKKNIELVRKEIMDYLNEQLNDIDSECYKFFQANPLCMIDARHVMPSILWQLMKSMSFQLSPLPQFRPFDTVEYS